MKRKRTGSFLFIVLFGTLLLACPKTTSQAAKEALALCAETVIPSLFPFFVLSSFAVSTGFLSAAGTLISPVASALFSVSGSGAAAFVTGLLCGSPTGAKTVAETYQKGMIEKEEAERLLGFCNNAGPVFIIGAVGKMLGDARLGKTLLIVHIIASILAGVILSIGHRKRRKTAKTTVFAVGFGEALVEAVTGSVKVMLNVCGYVVLFSVLIAFLRLFFLKMAVAPLVANVIGGVLEMTVGAKEICASGASLSVKLVLLSGVLGFGGLCVFCQGCSAVSGTGLSVRTYFWGKVMHAGISAFLMKLFLDFRTKGGLPLKDLGTSGAIFGILLLLFVVLPIVDKRGKNTYNKENRG